MVRNRIAIVAAVAASVSIVWLSAAEAQTDPPPSTIPTTIASTTPSTRPATTRPQPSTTDVIQITTTPTTPRNRTTTTRRGRTTTTRRGSAPSTIGGVVNPTTITGDTTTSVESTTSTSIERTTTSRTPRTTAPPLSSKKNDTSKLLLFAALGAVAVALIGIVAWALSRRNGPGSDGPYLIPDDRPSMFADAGLQLDEEWAGPAGDPLEPIVLATSARKPARPPKQTRATYKRKPKLPPPLTDEEFSAVVTPGASVFKPESPSEPFFPPDPGSERFFRADDPFVPRGSEPAPAPEPVVEPPSESERVIEPPPASPTSPPPSPPAAMPEIEDIDLAGPMDLTPEDVSMDIDFGDPNA